MVEFLYQTVSDWHFAPRGVRVPSDALKPKAESNALYRQRPDGRKSLARLFAESPFKGMSMEFERFSDTLPPAKLKWFLLDTNIPSELTYPKPQPEVERWLDKVSDDVLFFSVIRWRKYARGLRNCRRAKNECSFSNGST